MGHEKGAFWNWKTNATQISIMIRWNETPQFGVSLAPVNISAPGYLFFLGNFSPSPLSVNLLLSNSALLFSSSFFQRGSSDSRSSEELPRQAGYRGLRPSSSGSEEGVQGLFEVGIHHQCNPASPEQKSPAHDKGTGINKMTAQDPGSCMQLVVSFKVTTCVTYSVAKSTVFMISKVLKVHCTVCVVTTHHLSNIFLYFLYFYHFFLYVICGFVLKVL